MMSLFPKNISEFACANLEDVRLQPWFADFKGQVLPRELYGLDQFLISAGINPNTQVKKVAWSIGGPPPKQSATRISSATSSGDGGPVPGEVEAIPDSDEFLAIVAGQFDPDSIKAALAALNWPAIQIEGHTLYPIATSGRGTDTYFMTIDSDTVAVGQRLVLRNLIAVTQGSAESLLSNEKVVALVQQVNDVTIWGVFNGSGARQAIRQLAPGAAQFTESGKLFQDLQSLVMTAKVSSSDVTLHFEIATDTPEDSVMLTQILQAGLLVRKYMAKQSSPSNQPNLALAALLDHVSVTPNSSLVELSLNVTEEQIRDLILQRTFSPGD
jgi:hypothetical protein